MYLKKPTKKELQEDVIYYEHFYNYVRDNHYSIYCNAVEYAIQKIKNQNR
jgi:hypothetical protein